MFAVVESTCASIGLITASFPSTIASVCKIGDWDEIGFVSRYMRRNADRWSAAAGYSQCWGVFEIHVFEIRI
jgi:hypothetical protein